MTKGSLIIMSILMFLFEISMELNAQSACDFIENIQEYQDSIKIESKSTGDIIDTSTFNLRTYLLMFDKLRIASNKLCIYFYLDNLFDGNPYLCVIDDTISFDDYINKQIQKLNDQDINDYDLRHMALYEFTNEPSKRAKYNIIPEDSPSGYMQFLFFYQMGEQFALKWHSNYEEKYVICSTEKAKSVISEYENSEFFETNLKKLKKLNSIDLEPIIGSNKKYYVITWIEIETHSGIYKRTYIISRISPYKVKLVKESELVKITPNFVY